jgi:hypothetical protein
MGIRRIQIPKQKIRIKKPKKIEDDDDSCRKKILSIVESAKRIGFAKVESRGMDSIGEGLWCKVLSALRMSGSGWSGWSEQVAVRDASHLALQEYLGEPDIPLEELIDFWDGEGGYFPPCISVDLGDVVPAEMYGRFEDRMIRLRIAKLFPWVAFSEWTPLRTPRYYPLYGEETEKVWKLRPDLNRFFDKNKEFFTEYQNLPLKYSDYADVYDLMERADGESFESAASVPMFLHDFESILDSALADSKFLIQEGDFPNAEWRIMIDLEAGPKCPEDLLESLHPFPEGVWHWELDFEQLQYDELDYYIALGEIEKEMRMEKGLLGWAGVGEDYETNETHGKFLDYTEWGSRFNNLPRLRIVIDTESKGPDSTSEIRALLGIEV